MGDKWNWRHDRVMSDFLSSPSFSATISRRLPGRPLSKRERLNPHFMIIAKSVPFSAPKGLHSR